MTKALRREALALILLLCAWEAALTFLGSFRAHRIFAAERPAADLADLAGDMLRPEEGALQVPGALEPPSVARLAGPDLRPDTGYLVAIRAEAGLRFSVHLIDRAGQRLAAKLQVPPRGESEEFLFPLEPEGLPSSSRLEIWNETSSDVVIQELRFHELGAALGAVRAAVALLGPLALVLFALRHRPSLGEFLRSGRGRSAAERRWWEGVIAFAFFLACFHAFQSAPVQQILDSKFNTVVSHRLISEGTLTLPENFSPGEDEALPYQLQTVGERVYHFYPNAVAVLNAPFVAVFDRFGLAPIAPNGLFLRHRENRILAFAAAIQAAALCALLYLLARLYLRPLPALALAALFAFGTQIFSSVSRPYWSHSWALLLLAAGIYPLLSPALRERAASYMVSASLLSWSFFCRPPMSLSIVGLVGYVAVTRRRWLPWLAIPGLAWAALFVAYSLRTFDSFTPPYFLTSHLQSGVLGVDTLQRSYPNALLGTLFSVSRGLFVYVPFLALLLVLVVRYWRRLPHRPLAIVALGAVFAHWQVVCTNKAWFAGGFGPRLLTDIVTWLYLLAILVVLAWRQDPGFGRGGRVFVQAVAVLLVAASILVNARGANTRGRIYWDGYSIWDWRQPHFLGRVPPPAAPRTLGERIAELAAERDPGARMRLFDEIVRAESLAERPIDGRMTAWAVTWDHWTYGSSPALLTVTNSTRDELVPRLALATWAPRDAYPITVSVVDGGRDRSYTLAAAGTVEIALAPVPAGSSRVYVVRSDKGWRPGGADDRVLGVQLRAVEAAADG